VTTKKAKDDNKKAKDDNRKDERVKWLLVR
jgi:hypothetical protein